MLAPILQHGGHRPKERPVQVPYAIFLNTDRLLVLLEIRSSTAGLRLRPVGGRHDWRLRVSAFLLLVLPATFVLAYGFIPLLGVRAEFHDYVLGHHR